MDPNASIEAPLLDGIGPMLESDEQHPFSFTQRTRSSNSERCTSTVAYDDISGTESVVKVDNERLTLVEMVTEGYVADKAAWYHYFTKQKWTEDGSLLKCAAVIFIVVLILSIFKQSIGDYQESYQWVFGFLATGMFITVKTHMLTNKDQKISEYLSIFAISIAAAAVGSYKAMHNAGLSGSFWAIIMGMTLRYFGMNPAGILPGEYFIKLGVTIYAVNLRALTSFIAPALVIGWIDTSIVLAVGVFIGTRVLGMDDKDACVVAAATAICGSSAAAAISASVRTPPIDGSPMPPDNACRSVIALMGLLNTPLMPLLPLLYNAGHVHPYIVGGWIGGSIDSVGQVVASASLGGENVLLAATLIKVSQTVFIGVACLALTGIYKGTYSPRIIIEKFPAFITGFFIVSFIVTIMIHHRCTKELGYVLFRNLLVVSEWCSLMGFARIGTQIDIDSFVKNKGEHTIIKLYLATQFFDLCTTLFWSYVMFTGVHYDKDDDEIE